MKVFYPHMHSVYSIKDAIAQPIDYVKFIHEYNKNSTKHEILGFALTEHGNMYSNILYHEACVNPLKSDEEKRTLKPVYGNEIYHTEDLEVSTITSSRDLNHLILLAKNDIGLRNLFKITTHSGLNKMRPSSRSRKDFQVTDEKFIEKHGEGIICLSACLGGKLSKLIMDNKYEEAKNWAIKMSKIFDEFYLEIQPHDTIPEQLIVNDAIMRISKETNIPVVLTTDTHYILKEDKKYHNLMLQMDNAKPYESESHFWNPEELIDFCNKYNIPLEVIENTEKIFNACNADVTPKDPKGLMPNFPCPDGYNEDAYLIKLATEGLKKRFEINKDIKNIREYIVRLNYELDIITQMGFSGYFLILYDWFKWCKENKIPLGPGRGSAAGSLVAYCLDITKIDPIKNGLIFERFLNPSRIEEPDVDTDISKVHRSQAIEYLKTRYGEDHVCQIVTFGKYKLKNTIKAVLSADRGFNFEFQNSITSLVPAKIGDETDVTYELIEDIVNNADEYLSTDKLSDREYSQVLTIYNKLQEVFKDNPEVKDAITRLNGAISNVGIHAGGVVISSKNIGDYIPLMKGSDTAVLNVCQANMDGVHFFKGLKIDALGLKTLSQIRLCMDLANIPEEWLDNEETDDPKIYEFLRQGNTANVFQMHKFTPTKMIKDFKVNNLEGLTAVNAGNRPGPLGKGEDGKSMVDRYVEVVNTGKIPSIDPRIDYIFEPTNAQMWYQEQLQELGRVMAGYSLGDADLRIRKVIAKKLREKIPEIRNEFVYGKESLYDNEGKVTGISDKNSKYCIGAVRNGFDEKLALKLFSDMEAFASYCFNKSHSAAYGFVAYRTAWLSYYYPVEWNVACLTLDSMDGAGKDKIISTLNSCKKRNIPVLPPDINTSRAGFTVATLDDGSKAIRFGFVAIKDVGENIADIIHKLIEVDGPFKSFDDFIDRTINAKTNGTLRAICLDDNRYHSIKEDKNGEKTKTLKNPFSKRNIVPLILSGAFDSLEENRYKLFNQYITYKKDKDELKDESNYMLKDKLALELELLGFYVSQHPLDGDAFPYVDLDLVKDNQSIKVAGILKGHTTSKTKKGDKFYKLKIELKDGRIVNVNIFKNTYTKHPESVKGLSSQRAKDGKEILVVEGRYSAAFNNINANNVLKVRSSSDLTDKEIPELDEDIQDLEVDTRPAKKSPLDEELMMKVSNE